MIRRPLRLRGDRRGADRGRDVEAQIDPKQTRSYENAVDRVAHIRTLHERAGDPDGFNAYLAELRDRHRQKTKFTRLLDEAGLYARAG